MDLTGPWGCHLTQAILNPRWRRKWFSNDPFLGPATHRKSKFGMEAHCYVYPGTFASYNNNLRHFVVIHVHRVANLLF